MFDETTLQENGKKDIRFDSEARSRLIDGIDKLADAVKTTLGPGGRNVIIQKRGRTPIVTKDGVTVARHVVLSDPHEDAGAQVVREAASRTNDVAGDGTTTATVLVQALVHGGQKVLAAGHQPKLLKQGMERALADVVAELRRCAIAVTTSEQIAHVGTISANGEREIGDAIAEAMDVVGPQGIITIEEAKGMETHLELVDGIRLDRGYTSPYFVNDVDRMQVTYENAYVLVTNRQYKSMLDLVPVLEKVQKEAKPILIIADSVEGEALKLLTANKSQGRLECCVIVAPGRGEHRIDLLGDIAAMTGAKLITDGDGIKPEDIELDYLGVCGRITVTRHHTTLIQGSGDEDIKYARKAAVERKLLDDPTLDDVETRKLQARMQVLGGAAAIIKVGGATEVEMGERKDRIVDALNATQAAAEEGIVPGGGVALWRTSRALELEAHRQATADEQTGYRVVLDACCAPIRQILENAGQPAERVTARLEDMPSDMGFNAAKGSYESMLRSGVIDPVKVTRSALENAVSVGGIVLTVGASIVEIE